MARHARNNKKRDLQDDYPDVVESLEPEVSDPILFGGDETPQSAMVVADQAKAKGRHGNRGPKPEMTAREKKSKRMRILLIVIVVLLVAIIGALIYCMWMFFDESQNLASQQIQQQSALETEVLKQEETKDASTATAKTTEVPDLSALMGLTLDESIAALKHGATVSSSREVNEEGNPVKTSVTVGLTDEPADTRLGTPTVYLGLNEGGTVVMVGYSAATSALGYGSLSFADAIKNENIVEKTLAEAGIDVAAGTVVLPTDKTEYSTYDTDGTTLVQERASFSGTAVVDGVERTWSSTLSYDYKLANASGNLADTIRQIYVYLEA